MRNMPTSWARAVVKVADQTPLELCDRVEARQGRIAIGIMHLAKGLELKAVETPEADHTYRKARLDGEEFAADPGQFYEESYERRINAMIDHIVDIEGPIHEDVLIRRIARHHGFQRAGRQIRDLVLRLAKERRGRTNEGVGSFFWRQGTLKDRLAPARFAGRDDEVRNVERIAMEELRAIHTALGLDGNVVELARSLGIARLSGAARDRLERVHQ